MPNLTYSNEFAKLIIAIYCRVSSEDQAERGTIEIQKEFAAKYVNLYNLEVFDYYCDDGVSGTLPLEQRPEGKRLLEDAAKKRFNMVIFYKLDRLGRKVRVILNAVNDLDALGVTVKSMTEPFENETPTGKFLLTTLAGIAELDRDTILSRMWSGAQYAAKQGRWLGGVIPYGYMVADKKLVISTDPIPNCRLSEEDVIKIIFRMAAKEKANCAEIADYLNSIKIPTRYMLNGISGKRYKKTAEIWRPSRISEIIRSTTYKGLHQYGKNATHKNSKIITRSVPAIVSDEIWQEANNTMKDNRVSCKRNTKNLYLLQGMIRCGLCGLAYSPTFYKARNTSYYCCTCKGQQKTKFYNRDTCIGKPVRVDWLDNLVWSKCLELLKEPEKIYDAKPSTNKEPPNMVPTPTEFELIKSRIQELSTEREKLLDLYRKGIIIESDLTTQINKLYLEETELNNKIIKIDNQPKQELKRSKASTVMVLKEFIEMIKNTDINQLPFELKREVVKMLIDKVFVYTKVDPDKFYPSINVIISWRFDAAPFNIDYIENYTLTTFLLQRKKLKTQLQPTPLITLTPVLNCNTRR